MAVSTSKSAKSETELQVGIYLPSAPGEHRRKIISKREIGEGKLDEVGISLGFRCVASLVPPKMR